MRDKTYLVARREFMENLRTKAFWIGILVFPLMITMMIVIPIWIEKSKEARHFAVIDESGWLLDEVLARADARDLERALGIGLETRRAGGEAAASLPGPLRATAEALEHALTVRAGEDPVVEPAALERPLLQAVAARAAGLALPATESLEALVADDLAEPLSTRAADLGSWWAGLEPTQAGDLVPGSARSRYALQRPTGEEAELTAELNRRVGDRELFAYFVIGPDPVAASEGCKYVSTNLTDDELRDWFASLASSVVRDRRLASEDIDSDVARWVQEPLRFEPRKIAKGGEEAEVGTADVVRQYAPVAFVYLLWISVFSIAQMLLTNTVEEKSNRIMEVLLSSVSPLQLMVGKILGIAATGLAVVGTWMLFFIIAVNFIPLIMGAELGFNLGLIASDPVYIGSFLLYFVLGYLFIAALLVGIGAVCNSLKEAQNLMTPVTLMLIVPLLTMMPIGKDPNGTLARVMSYIPPFTPFVMMNRAAGPPTAFEYVATTALLLVSIAVTMWAAAKVFRIGILMTGKPPRPAEILRWLRTPVGVLPERKE